MNHRTPDYRNTELRTFDRVAAGIIIAALFSVAVYWALGI